MHAMHTSPACLDIVPVLLKQPSVCGYLRHRSHDLCIVKAGQERRLSLHFRQQLWRGAQHACVHVSM